MLYLIGLKGPIRVKPGCSSEKKNLQVKRHFSKKVKRNFKSLSTTDTSRVKSEQSYREQVNLL